MDTQLLTAFIAVTEQQSFSIAAEQLGLTQPAVSKRIALLEQQLGFSLFDRIGRTVYLTETGQRLLPRARHILEMVEDTQRIVTQQHDKVDGNLRIATSHHIGLHRLPPILKTYTEHFPNVRLQLQFMDSEKAIHAIEHGDFDLAAITLPEDTDSQGKTAIQYHPIWQDSMQVVVNQDHPLAVSNTISLKSLSEYPAILPDITTRTSRLIKQYFDNEKLKLDITMTTNHLDAIKMMVNVGLGWSALPERLADDSLHTLSIQKVQFIRDLGCVHHRHKTLSNASRAMLKLLQSQR